MAYEFCARIHRSSGEVCGAGILVDPRHVLTCAHVINAALEKDAASESFPDGTVSLDFPYSPEKGIATAEVVGWHPPIEPGLAQDEIGDIAVLCLRTERKDLPARLEISEPHEGQSVEFKIPGFPAGKPDGELSDGITSGPLPGHRLQVRKAGSFAGGVQPGYSGAPALAGGLVLGMAFGADRDPEKFGYLVPGYRLDQAWLLARNPYKGLARFEPEDAEMFFGREDETERVNDFDTSWIGI